MERKLYLELCQRQAMKGGVLVEYGGIAYQPYAYELKFQSDGKTKHGDFERTESKLPCVLQIGRYKRKMKWRQRKNESFSCV